jgi:hypothetical protein
MLEKTRPENYGHYYAILCGFLLLAVSYTRELRRCPAEGEAEKGDGQCLF